jgi:hypothetical protein
MHLLWTIVGFSKAYSAFTGWSEVIGGLFLLFRRTTLLGALITAMVMFNVFMLNMCFDVPVKIYSATLVLMACFLAAPDAKRLWDLFIAHQSFIPQPIKPLFANRRWHIGSIGLKILFIGYYLLYQCVWDNRQSQTVYGDLAKKPPLYGIYDVQSFQKNNKILPPLFTDSTYWRKMIISYPGGTQVQMANDSTKYFVFEVDSTLKSVVMHRYRDTLKNKLFIEQPTPEDLTLKGLYGSDSILVHLKRYDEKQFLLMRRGFNWVNEFPYN